MFHKKSFIVAGLFVVAFCFSSFAQITYQEEGFLLKDAATMMNSNSTSGWWRVDTLKLADTGVVSTKYGDTVKIKGFYNNTDATDSVVVSFVNNPTIKILFRIPALTFFGKLPTVYGIYTGSSSGLRMFEQCATKK